MKQQAVTDTLEAHIRSMVTEMLNEREAIWRDRLQRHLVRAAEYEGTVYLEQGMLRDDGTIDVGARP